MFSETLLDKVLAIAGRYPAERVTLNRNVMLEQIARGGGGVIVTSHMGCLELCRALAQDVSGLRLVALVHTAHAEAFNQLLRRVAPEDKIELMQVTSLDPGTAIQLASRVAEGAFIAIAGDRVPVQGARHAMASFLGRDAPFPVGPYVLAATLGCPLFAMGCTHRGESYVIDFIMLADTVSLPRQSRDAALEAHVTKFAEWLESQVCAAPYDWFNFFPFWDQIPHDSPRP
ncbi:acyltransferase [Xanthomonadaceae bacterium XH05]|nr:acyltransferase [Xanthomonadaceae bacterium XH05]